MDAPRRAIGWSRSLQSEGRAASKEIDRLTAWSRLQHFGARAMSKICAGNKLLQTWNQFWLTASGPRKKTRENEIFGKRQAASHFAWVLISDSLARAVLRQHTDPKLSNKKWVCAVPRLMLARAAGSALDEKTSRRKARESDVVHYRGLESAPKANTAGKRNHVAS